MNILLTLLGTIVAEFFFVELILKNIIIADPFVIKRDIIYYLLERNKNTISNSDIMKILETIIKLENKHE
jgi:hypothetical protein